LLWRQLQNIWKSSNFYKSIKTILGLMSAIFHLGNLKSDLRLTIYDHFSETVAWCHLILEKCWIKWKEKISQKNIWIKSYKVKIIFDFNIEYRCHCPYRLVSLSNCPNIYISFLFRKILFFSLAHFKFMIVSKKNST
jgi:hypothetical protein